MAGQTSVETPFITIQLVAILHSTLALLWEASPAMEAVAAMSHDRPGHPVPGIQSLSLQVFAGAARALLDDFPNDLMTQDGGHRNLSASFHGVQITATQCAAQHTHKRFTPRWCRQWHGLEQDLPTTSLKQRNLGLIHDGSGTERE
jgi:hypothetical protein